MSIFFSHMNRRDTQTGKSEPSVPSSPSSQQVASYLARIRLLAVGISLHVWLEKYFFKNLSFVVVQILRIKTQLRSPGRLPAAEGSEGGLGRGTRLRGAIKKTTTDVGFLAQGRAQGSHVSGNIPNLTQQQPGRMLQRKKDARESKWPP